MSEDYLKKIVNSDLKNENFNKKYYMRESTLQIHTENLRIIKENPNSLTKKLFNIDLNLSILFFKFIKTAI